MLWMLELSVLLLTVSFMTRYGGVVRFVVGSQYPMRAVPIMYAMAVGMHEQGTVQARAQRAALLTQVHLLCCVLQDMAVASVGDVQFMPDSKWWRRRSYWLRY